MIIYKITNKINGKIYIGQTTHSIEKRWKEHCRDNDGCSIHNAIRKYGKENFTVEQIDVVCDRDELNKKEQYWIKFYDSMNKEKGYNLTSGGDHFEASEETKLKMSKALKGKFAGEKHPMWGKHHTEESKLKMSKSKKGKCVGEEWHRYHSKRSEEGARKWREAMVGRKVTGVALENVRAARELQCVPVICVETGEVFKGIKYAAQRYGLRQNHISSVCRGDRKTCGGYHWQYIKEVK